MPNPLTVKEGAYIEEYVWNPETMRRKWGYVENKICFLFQLKKNRHYFETVLVPELRKF